ncbi:hypothetical protein A0257_06760 [Hymenobacter psoromatis]|uniref:ABC-three component system protein n=1 Tax=Hymenobacter psoromatis TaxID=1484116 RepID=UPI00078D9F10|nr:ABC-three component system protein [Hymenobacter psoromatis]AMR26838.1 hypothetical protein A0257_06760 [Hymenobacter psoromatis]
MLSITRTWYEREFELAVRKKRGEEFQDFFATIMTLAYQGDFVRVRPWGREGDRKNDGYLISTKELFQVYAPTELEVAVTIRKIREDFAGAVQHWDAHLTKWTLVHNSLDGVPPAVLAVFLELRQQHPSRQIGQFTPYDLRTIVFTLGAADIALVLGPPLESLPPSQITFDEIRVVLENVARVFPVATESVGTVDYGKLDANGLNPESRQIILWGYGAASRVAQFLDTYTFDPELGQKVAATLRAEYLRLKATGSGPNEIFAELLSFVSYHRGESPTAAIAVLAHFFQTCDIFEAAPTFTS